MATRQEKYARYQELLKQGMSPSEALHQTDQEFGEGYSEESKQYRERPERYYKEKPAKSEYLKTRQQLVHGLRKVKEVGKGIVGVGSRRPVKEAAISLAAKTIAEHKKILREKKAAQKRTKVVYVPQRRVRYVKIMTSGDMGMGSMFGDVDPIGNVFMTTPKRKKKTKKSSDPLGLKGFY